MGGWLGYMCVHVDVLHTRGGINALLQYDDDDNSCCQRTNFVGTIRFKVEISVCREELEV